jgi:pimeloyl-ACP methyl ester carboxylesterase
MQQFMQIPVGREQLTACLHTPDPTRLTATTPVVLCCHGLTGTRVGSCYRFVQLARRLVDSNIACLRFDFRGCGESDGRFEDVTVSQFIEDVRAVLAALGDMPGCDPTRLGVAASSFGALTASLALADEAALKCLVLWAPVARMEPLVARSLDGKAKVLLDEQGWLDHNGHRLGRAFLSEIPTADAPTELAKKPRPTLIFHGRGDQSVPIEHGKAYEAALLATGADVRLEILPTDDHGMRSVVLNERIVADSADWFQRFLQPEESSESTA